MPPRTVTRITGFPPHQSWPHALPNTRKFNWVPFTADQQHVLMVHLPYPPPSGPSQISLAMATKAGRLVPVRSSAYPHHAELGRMYMEYPWIVGTWYGNQPTVDWKLWAANVVTGRYLLLDQANGPNATVMRQYPDVTLNRHRVVWDDSAFRNVGRQTTVLHNRLDLYNLDTGQKTFIAPTTGGRTSYLQPTLYGQTIVVVRIQRLVGGQGHPIYDLVRYQLGSHAVTNLTHNTQQTGVSMEPSLWRQYLLFKQSPSPSAEGDIVLWDLRKGHFPLWRKPGAVLLDRFGEMPRWADGVAWWGAEGQATSAVFLPGSNRVWTFQYGPHVDLPHYYKYTWQVQASGGGNLVIERDRAGTRYAPTYFLWHFSTPGNRGTAAPRCGSSP